MKQFWKDTPTGPKVTLYEIKQYLNYNNYKIFALERQSKVIIHIEGKFVTIKQKDDLIDFLYSTVDSFQFKSEDEKGYVFDMFSRLKSTIKSSLENWLSPIDLDFITDTEEKAFMFFMNSIIEITQDSISCKSYDEIEGYVWYESIKEHEITLDLPELYNSLTGVFHQFLFDIVYDDDDLKKLMGMIGYLVHNYKTTTNAKAVILYDSNVSLTHPSGGTGKSLLCSLIESATIGVTKNGRSVDFTYRFAMEDITIDINLLTFDDIPENFSLTRLFPDITGVMTIYRKYESPLIIPYSLSPKILINSNYPLLETGNSFDRRKYEFVINSIFGKNCKPDEHYGMRLIDDWDVSEWNKFYNTIFICLQTYLLDGLVPQSRKLKDYLLKNSFDEVTLNIAARLEKNRDFNKKELYDQYKEANTGYNVPQNTFTRKLKEYARLMEYSVAERHSGDASYIAFH